MPLESEPGSEDARWIWGALLLCLSAFSLLPDLDLRLAQHLYTAGIGFTHAQDPMVLASYRWTRLVGQIILVALVVLAVTGAGLARVMSGLGWNDVAKRCRSSWRHMAAVAVLCGALGPGLVVEVGLKNLVGRPRPVQVTAFGGDQAYVPPFKRGIDPRHHRSFVSSHAAAGFWLMSLGLTLGPVWRRRWLLIGLTTGGAIGVGRMMQGGHFASDIIFAFYAVWVPCEIVALLDRRRMAKSRHPQ